jgi:hypothetical protein
MAWREFAAIEDIGALIKNQLSSLMSRIVDAADLLYTTPAQAASANGDYVGWSERTARGVLIDEAANMHRADVGCVWRNDGLPCFFGGDPGNGWSSEPLYGNTQYTSLSQGSGDSTDSFGAMVGQESPRHSPGSAGYIDY